MKKLLLFLYIILAATITRAQKVYFIYLQSETSIPFYLKMGEKVVSSTTEGYLILPKLRDSTYNFTIGFSGNGNEHRFSVNINKADRGFLIKKVNDALSLFDLQTLRNYNAIQATVSSAPTQVRNDNFTKLLSQAADDTSLLVESLTLKEIKKEEPKIAVEEVAKSTGTSNQDAVTAPPVKASEPVVENVENVSAGGTVASEKEKSAVKGESAVKQDLIVKEESVEEKKAVDTNAIAASVNVSSKKEPVVDGGQEFRRSVVLRHAESSTSDGFGLVFLDVTDGLIDTVKIIIPNPPVVIEAPVQAAPATADRKFLDLPDTIASVSSKVNPAKPEVAKAVLKCTTLANDDDFFKIRRDMAAKKVDEDMIAQAKKHFKTRCFKTEHIKYLSVLFLTDAGKYQFFDAAHLHVSDVQKFEALQSEISDPYYVNRFKALVGR